MTLAIAAAASLALVWIVYPCAIFTLSRFRIGVRASQAFPDFSVGVVIAAHNEGGNIADRIRNIAAANRLPGTLSVIVASDGSSDDTARAAKAAGLEYGIEVIIHDLKPQRGRAGVHNAAVAKSDCDVLVFTDAETVFDHNFLQELLRPFSDPKVGFASGVLSWGNPKEQKIAQHAGLYWKFELAMRRWETLVGVNVFGTGACCAVRRSLYRPIPSTGDVDFTTPLDVVLQGHRCVQVETAKAMDRMPGSAIAEYRVRVRMTSKNLRGTISRWGVRGLLRHPILTGVLLLHKIGRWFTPFFGGALVLGSILILPHAVGWTLLAVELGALLLAVAGGLGAPIPFASAAWSFCVANAAFGVGILKTIVGAVPATYRPLNRRS